MQQMKKGNDMNSDDMTPFDKAAFGDAVAMMEWLKMQGVDVDVRDSDGRTPMHHTARDNAVDSMEWLKKTGSRCQCQGFIGLHSDACRSIGK